MPKPEPQNPVAAAASPTAAGCKSPPKSKGTKKQDGKHSTRNDGTTPDTGNTSNDTKLAGKLKDRLKLLIQRSSGNASVLGNAQQNSSSGNSAGVLDLSRLGLEYNPPTHSTITTGSHGKAMTTLDYVFSEIAANPAVAHATSTVTFASNNSIGPAGISRLLRHLLPESLPNITCLDLCQVGFSNTCVPDLLAALGYHSPSAYPRSNSSPLGFPTSPPSLPLPVSRTLRSCTKIKLGDNEITAPGVRRLVDGLLSANVDMELGVGVGGGTTPGSLIPKQHRNSGTSHPTSTAMVKHGLVQIHLGGNSIGDDGVTALADLFGNHLGQLGDSMLPHRIEYLGLRSVKVGSLGMSSLASRLLLNSTLAELQLRHNPLIGDTGISAFAIALRTMSGLTHLDLKEVGMTQHGLNLLATAVKQSPSKLRSLCLSNNNLAPTAEETEGSAEENFGASPLLPFRSLGDALCASPSLTVLNLDSCSLNSQTAGLIFQPLSELIHREITPATLMNLAANRPVVGNLHSRTTPPTVSIDHHCLSTLTLNENNLRARTDGGAPTFMSFAQVMKGLLSAEPKRLGLLSVEMARCNLSSRCFVTLLDAISAEPVPGFKSALKHLDISSNFLGVPTHNKRDEANRGTAITSQFPPHEKQSSPTVAAPSLQGFPMPTGNDRNGVLTATPPPPPQPFSMIVPHQPPGSPTQQMYVPVAFVPAGPVVPSQTAQEGQNMPLMIPMQAPPQQAAATSSSTTFLQLQASSTSRGVENQSSSTTPTFEDISCGTQKLAEVLRNNRSLIRFMINDNELSGPSVEVLCRALEGTHRADATIPPSNIRYLVFGGQSKTPPLANEVSDELRARMNGVIDKNKQYHSAVVAQGRGDRTSSKKPRGGSNPSGEDAGSAGSSQQMSPHVWSVENFTTTNFSTNTTPTRGWNTLNGEPVGGSLTDELGVNSSHYAPNLTGCSLNSVGSVGSGVNAASPPLAQSAAESTVQVQPAEFITSPFHVPTLQGAGNVAPH